MTDEQIKSIEARWKSDVDRKLDALVEFVTKYEDYLKLCIEREMERKQVRRAIIEKSLASLVWSVVVAVGVSLWYMLKLALRA